MGAFYDQLESDLRFREGLNACFNCGTCTAVCPAAAVSDYDPRMVVDLVQERDEQELVNLLKSDTIWLCGECLSCKTRCPRGNTPCYIIQALRALSIESGLFIQSREGRKQLAIKRTVGDHILKYGYCVYLDEIDNEMYPEQGPGWEWFRNHRVAVLERLGASYQKYAPGTLRAISEESLQDLQRIFDETGATERFKKIEQASANYARENGLSFGEGKDEYFKRVYETRDEKESE